MRKRVFFSFFFFPFTRNKWLTRPLLFCVFVLSFCSNGPNYQKKGEVNDKSKAFDLIFKALIFIVLGVPLAQVCFVLLFWSYRFFVCFVSIPWNHLGT